MLSTQQVPVVGTPCPASLGSPPALSRLPSSNSRAVHATLQPQELSSAAGSKKAQALQEGQDAPAQGCGIDCQHAVIARGLIVKVQT